MLRYRHFARCCGVCQTLRGGVAPRRSAVVVPKVGHSPPTTSQGTTTTTTNITREFSTPVPFWIATDATDPANGSNETSQQQQRTVEIVGTPEESIQAAQVLRHWLKTEEGWRDETLSLIEVPERTLDALELEQNTQKSDNKFVRRKQRQRRSRLDSFRARNQRWYYDLLDPFVRRISHDSSFRQQLQPVLNELIQSGLGDRTVCAEYLDKVATQQEMLGMLPTKSKPVKARQRRHLREAETLVFRLHERLVDLEGSRKLSQEISKEMSARARTMEEEGAMLRLEFNSVRPSATDDVSEDWSALKEKHNKTDLARYTIQHVRMCLNSITNELGRLKEKQHEKSVWALILAQDSADATKDQHCLAQKLRILFAVLDDLQDGYKQRFALSGQSNEQSIIALREELEEICALLQMYPKTSPTDFPHVNSSLSDEELESLRHDTEHEIRVSLRKIKAGLLSLRRLAERLDRAHSDEEVVGVARGDSTALAHDDDQVQRIAQTHKEKICQCLANYISDVHSRLLDSYRSLDSQSKLTDPHEWFSTARKMKRKIIFHGGPTNSGKTYSALQCLRQAKRGMYYGPLRLLAAEVFDELNLAGIACNLYTGQEKKYVRNATHGAATVEMAQSRVGMEGPQKPLDVVVIDEVQMLGDPDRGASWTRALLGLDCPEIHVCGGMEAAALVGSIAESCGDDFEMRTYERFLPLMLEEAALDTSMKRDEDFRYSGHVQPGDCIVAFNRKDIFAIRREIEKETHFKCSVVYGTLPPKTRAEQAKLFNDPHSGYDILIASDAIGMGLNLNIRRIIFNSIYKVSQGELVRVPHTEIKQIAGRAGRRNSAFDRGLVTSRSQEDLPYIRECLEKDIDPLQRAAILPTPEHLEAFSRTLENSGMRGKSTADLRHVLLCFNEIASVDGDYFLGYRDSMHVVAEILQNVCLSLQDKYTLSLCPVVLQSQRSVEALKRYAVTLEQGEYLRVARHCLDPEVPQDFDELALLCDNVNELDLLLWMQLRFRSKVPLDEQEREWAREIRDETTQRINEALQEVDELGLNHCYITNDMNFRSRFNRSRRKARARQQAVQSQRTAFAV